MRSINSRGSSRAAFTLVELLVVIGIIGVLISLLLPALAKAREQANSVKCASNLRQVGQAMTMFSQDHHQRVPFTQVCPWGAPWWHNTMYAFDFYALTDTYKLNPIIFTCPSNPPSNGSDLNLLWDFGGYDEVADRAVCASWEATPINVTPGGSTSEFGEGTLYEPQAYPTEGGTGGPYYLFVQFLSYAYMGNNPENTSPGNYWVSTTSKKTTTGTSADSNPPLMCDMTFYQNGNYNFNHGRRWSIPSIDSTTGTASSHQGDVKLNVLFVDGHVENKSPDHSAYVYFYGAVNNNWYFFR